MRKSLLWLLIVVLSISLAATFSLVGCKEETPAEEEAVEEVEEAAEEVEEAAEEVEEAAEEVEFKEGPFTIAVVDKGLGHPCFNQNFDGAEEAAAELGDKIFEVGPDDWSVEGQIAVVEALIDQKVDGFTISANDKDALAPVCKKAMDAGIRVVSFDAPVSADACDIFVNNVSFEDAGRTQVKAIAEMINYEGEIAILSATPQAPNQSKWIDWMYEELKDPKYNKMKLVDVVYGDDMTEKSYDKALGLIKAYPDLKGVISPTCTGVAAMAAAVSDKGLTGKIYVTGLALPSMMKDYVLEGICTECFLWSFHDLGYVTTTAMHKILTGEFKVAEGNTFTVGRPTDGAPDMVYEVLIDEEGAPYILLGPMVTFNKDNIVEWAEKF